MTDLLFQAPSLKNPGGNQTGDNNSSLMWSGKGKGQKLLWQTTPSMSIGERLLYFKYHTLFTPSRRGTRHQ